MIEENDWEESSLASPHESSVPELPGSGVEHSSVRKPEVEIVMPGSGGRSLSPVSIGGGGVEIRGEAAALIVEILDDWIRARNRRIEFIRRGEMDAASRRAIAEIHRKTGLVYRVLQAWEGVLSVSGKEDTRPNPEP